MIFINIFDMKTESKEPQEKKLETLEEAAMTVLNEKWIDRMTGRVPFLNSASQISVLYDKFVKQVMTILNKDYQECLDLLYNSGEGGQIYQDNSPQPVIAQSKDVIITHIDPHNSKALADEIKKTALAFEKDLEGGIGKTLHQYLTKLDGLFANLTTSFQSNGDKGLLGNALASNGSAPKPKAPDQLHA